MRDIKLPEAVRLRVAAHGASGRRWLDELGERVASLEKLWDMRTQDVLTGGSESLVMTAQRGDGRAAVLKVGLPGSSDLDTESRILRWFSGRGYVQLLAHDSTHNAMLLERLGPPLATLNLGVAREIDVLCATLRICWQAELPAHAAESLMTGAAKARWLAEFITSLWDKLEAPCARTTVDRALAFCAARAAAFAPQRCVAVHGDAHAWNALCVLPGVLPGQAQVAPDAEPANGGTLSVRFIDPDGLFAEPACDLAVPMREWSTELLAGDTRRLARQRCAHLASLTGVDERAIWHWGFMESVSTGLHVLDLGMTAEGQERLAVVDRLAAELGPD